MKLFLEVYIIQGVFLCDHFQNYNDLSSNRPISINLGSKSTENIRILIYTTHKHIIILFFKMPSLIPKDHLQSSTEVLHGYVTIPSDISWNAEIIAASTSPIFS